MRVFHKVSNGVVLKCVLEPFNWLTVLTVGFGTV